MKEKKITADPLIEKKVTCYSMAISDDKMQYGFFIDTDKILTYEEFVAAIEHWLVEYSESKTAKKDFDEYMQEADKPQSDSTLH